MSRASRLLALLAALLALPAHASDRVAVLQFQGDAPPSELNTLSRVARSGTIVAADAVGWDVMSRETMEVFAQDNGTDLSCLTEVCAVEIAKILHARLVVTGHVGKLGSAWIVTLDVHDAQSGANLASEVLQGRTLDELVGPLEVKAAAQLADALVAIGVYARVGGEGGEIVEQRRERGARRQLAVVSFRSDPPGAVVLVDGDLVCQSTPCSEELPVGVHTVKMDREDYRGVSESRRLGPGDEVFFKLTAEFATLTVTTDPPGLPLRVDGARRDRVEHLRLAPGRHEVVLDDPCWMRDGKTVVAQEGDQKTLRLKGTRRSTELLVRAVDQAGTPISAELWLDGRRLGASPGPFQVPTCSNAVVVRAGGFGDVSTPLRLSGKESFSMRVTLPRAQARREVRQGVEARQRDSRAASARAQKKDLQAHTTANRVLGPVAVGSLFVGGGVGFAVGFFYLSPQATTEAEDVGGQFLGLGLAVAGTVLGIAVMTQVGNRDQELTKQLEALGLAPRPSPTLRLAAGPGTLTLELRW